MSLTNSHAEQAVIGCCLQGEILAERVAGLRPEHFAIESHREAFSAIMGAWSKGMPTDPVMLDDMLTSRGSIGEDLAYWIACAESGYSTAMLPSHVASIRDKAQRRALLAAADQIAAMAHDGGSISEHLASASALVGGLAESEIRKGPRPLADVLRDHMPEMGERWTGRKDGLRTGFADLDTMLGGLRPGNLVLIAARPAMGKTALAMQIAARVAADGVVVAFSQEMADTELADRMLAAAGRIPLGTIVAGGLSSDEHERFAAALGRLKPLQLFIDDQPAQRISEIRAKAMKIRRRHAVALVVVDYLQLMSGDDGRKGGANRNAEIEHISRGLKALAKELACPVIALSQLNRELEKRPNKRPILSDLRDSGAIEQDADVVLMLYRDEIYNPDSPDKGTAEVLVRKHRQGRTGKAEPGPFAWRGMASSHPSATARSRTAGNPSGQAAGEASMIRRGHPHADTIQQIIEGAIAAGLRIDLAQVEAAQEWIDACARGERRVLFADLGDCMLLGDPIRPVRWLGENPAAVRALYRLVCHPGAWVDLSGFDDGSTERSACGHRLRRAADAIGIASPLLANELRAFKLRTDRGRLLGRYCRTNQSPIIDTTIPHASR